MKYFQIEGIINEELLNNFFHFWNNNSEDELSFVINSAGGKDTLSSMMISFINTYPQQITLISAGSYSAAFSLFYFSKCNRKIVNRSLGMYHMPYMKDVSLGIDNKMKYYEDLCQKENFKSHDESFVKTFMTKKELIQYNKGDDVYFTFKRMCEIFPDVEII